MKAQISIEQLVIVSVGLMIILSLILYGNKILIGYKDENKISLAKSSVRKLGDVADWVFSQGPPAKHTLQIYIPESVDQASLDNNTILLRVRTSAGISDVFYQTVPPLQGNIPSQPGYHFMSVTAFDDHVEIEVV